MKLRILLIAIVLSICSFSGPALLQAGTPNQHHAKRVKKEVTVYVTKTGHKYHTEGCRYLRRSSIPMKLSEAKLYYSPCSVCNPPK